MEDHSKEKLIQALEEEQFGLKVCLLHPEKVVYDEPVCPACRTMRELSYSTRKKLIDEQKLFLL
jgi:hypothetical protein